MTRLLFLFVFFVSVQYPLCGQYFLSKAIVDSFRIKTFISYEGEGDDRRLLSRTTYDTSGKTTSTCRVYYSDSTTRFHRDSFITRGDIFVTWHIAGSQMDSSVTTHRTENGWRMTTTESYQDGTVASRELFIRDSTRSVYMIEHLGNNFYCIINRSVRTYDEQGRITSNEWTDSIVSPKVRWQTEHERHEYAYNGDETIERFYSEEKGKLRLTQVSYWSTSAKRDSTVYFDRKGKVKETVTGHKDSLQRDTLRETRTRKGKIESWVTIEYGQDNTTIRTFTPDKGLTYIHTYYYEVGGLCGAETRHERSTGKVSGIHYSYEFY